MRKKTFFSLLIGIFCLLFVSLAVSSVKAEDCPECPDCPADCYCTNNPESCKVELIGREIRSGYDCGHPWKECCCPAEDDSDLMIRNPLKAAGFEDILDNLIGFIFNIAVVLAPLMIVIAGFLFVTAGGNSDQITRAKTIIIWTSVGFLIILLSRGIMGVIKNILGVI